MHFLFIRHSSVGRRTFKTKVCSCSEYFTEATRWIKEAEMVYSVGDLETSEPFRGLRFASSLKKLIQNSSFKKKVHQSEQKAQLDDRFFCGKQIAFMVHEYFWVTRAHEGGEMILPTETLSKNMDGLSNTACSWTTSRRSRSFRGERDRLHITICIEMERPKESR